MLATAAAPFLEELMAAGRFADYLKGAREKSGLTQSVLAERCGLTGSYISLLESGKKPAPSDRVVKRLATVLGLRLDDVLQVAHLDRAPDELRKTVERLRRQAIREREMRERTAEALFPFSIWNLVPGALTKRARSAVGPNLDTDIIEAIDSLTDLVRGTSNLEEFRAASRRLLDELPPEKRKRILDATPLLAEGSVEERGQRVVEAPEPGLPPEILPGDSIVIDASLSPAGGDVVLVQEGGRSALRRFAAGTAGVQGVVVEVRRRLRGPTRS
jgi:transcriptional regulator with XRE-family HTH domain